MEGGESSADLVINKRFVSEAELEERRKRRQEEWEKVRKPEDPKECPEEVYDPRSLYERLQEQKDKKQQEFEEQFKFKNMVRGLDEEESKFLDEVSRQQVLIEKQRHEEDLKELNEYRFVKSRSQRRLEEGSRQETLGKIRKQEQIFSGQTVGRSCETQKKNPLASPWAAAPSAAPPSTAPRPRYASASCPASGLTQEAATPNPARTAKAPSIRRARLSPPSSAAAIFLMRRSRPLLGVSLRTRVLLHPMCFLKLTSPPPPTSFFLGQHQNNVLQQFFIVSQPPLSPCVVPSQKPSPNTASFEGSLARKEKVQGYPLRTKHWIP
ncbi:PSME3-interacting protein isoform X2 [Thamnophis elegans]|nr:PSME3-interacting protein isoform X2 [Thamnophis elegans]XP_032086287.1 PSME3-interacting protein isoform X2 [Thamnophis elegans]